ncbi:hypothetical protein [Desulfovibrio sp. JC010]|uniref:hypothetical protein n=1 Tax=Desulfovibrio sp. JC010 TaxID=2593641 RepID=UPI0013D781F2|nr:hypothetical protein [Desulfovibrio sp. JC010]NDV28441.1 hypothetical protein [Desulfovibrio sp. JC010]
MSGKSFLKLFLVLALLAAAAAGGYFKLEEFSAAKVREAVARHDDLLQVDFERALINPLDESLHVWGLDCRFATGACCTVRKVEVESFDRKHSVPRFFRGRVQGVSIPVEFVNFGTLARDFRDLGYEKLDFDLFADYSYEDETKRLTVKSINFDGADLCRVSAGFSLGDVSLRGPGISGFIGTSMLDGSLVWQDLSLTEKLVALSAHVEGVPPDSYRKSLLESLQLDMQQARSLGNGYAENFYGELMKFIEKPERLVVRVEPTEPVPLLYMFMGRSFEELLDLYGITVEANFYSRK